MQLKKILAVLSLLLILPAITLLIEVHHFFVIGLNPFLGLVFVAVVLIILIPIVIFLFRRINNFFKGEICFTPDVLFAIGVLNFFISGFLLDWVNDNSTIDIHLHDTYFVIAHFHVMIFFGLIFGIFAAIYYWFPRITGRQMNKLLGQIHFWITFISTYFIFMPAVHYEGLAGMPRRYIDYSGWSPYAQFSDLNRFIAPMAIILLIGQLLFVFNLFYSMLKGTRTNT